MTPFYDEDGITIYCGDCREILPQLSEDSIDVIVTDPPYPDHHIAAFRYSTDLLQIIATLSVRQFVFWSAKAVFPLDFSAVHIWDKKTGCGSEYERLFERNGNANWKVFRHYLINSTVAANYGHDVFTGHPSQKPERLLMAILLYGSAANGVVLDPFMGSGTTLVSAKRLGRKAIGIEIEERYCELTVQRLAQGALEFHERTESPQSVAAVRED